MDKMMVCTVGRKSGHFGTVRCGGREGQRNLKARARQKNKQNINVVNFSFFVEKTGIFEGYIIIMKKTF